MLSTSDKIHRLMEKKTAQGNTDGNGIGDFYHTPPTGFLALCSANLPDDDNFELNTGEKPSDHFKAVTYTGAGNGTAVTGVGFQPDLAIFFNRDNVDYKTGYDSVRGNKRIYFSGAAAVESNGTLASFDTDGFTVNANGETGDSGINYTAWVWKAGGTAVSNTDGTITSSVSANTDAGFSIISYAGNSTAGATIGHGLNSAPEMIVVKNLDHDNQIQVYHTSLGTSQFIQFNSDAALSQSTYPMFNSTLPSDSVFTVGNIDHTNTSGYDYIAYAWHSVPGFSSIGSYTGNGSTDGPFINTGFKPAFVMIKNTEIAGEQWVIWDNARDTNGNPNSQYTYLDTTKADTTSTTGDREVDFLSNGFKIRGIGQPVNRSGEKIIYIAFAEDPFKYGNAR